MKYAVVYSGADFESFESGYLSGARFGLDTAEPFPAAPEGWVQVDTPDLPPGVTVWEAPPAAAVKAESKADKIARLKAELAEAELAAE